MSLDKDKLIQELFMCSLPEPFTINLSKETDLVISFDISKLITLGSITVSKLKDYYYGYLLLDIKSI